MHNLDHCFLQCILFLFPYCIHFCSVLCSELSVFCNVAEIQIIKKTQNKYTHVNYANTEHVFLYSTHCLLKWTYKKSNVNDTISMYWQHFSIYKRDKYRSVLIQPIDFYGLKTVPIRIHWNEKKITLDIKKYMNNIISMYWQHFFNKKRH